MKRAADKAKFIYRVAYRIRAGNGDEDDSSQRFE